MTSQTIDIEANDLLRKVADFKGAGYRLAQACALSGDGGLVLLYSFANSEGLETLRLEVADGASVESISAIYPYAFIYENEMSDLFGLKVSNMNIDFGGNFYQTMIPTPYCSNQEVEA